MHFIYHCIKRHENFKQINGKFSIETKRKKKNKRKKKTKGNTKLGLPFIYLFICPL